MTQPVHEGTTGGPGGPSGSATAPAGLPGHARRDGALRALARRVGVPQLLDAYRYLRRGIPLADFADYDDYWQARRTIAPDQFKTRFALGARHIPSGYSVMDVGCGEGIFLQYLRDRDPGVAVLGLDISEQAVELCNERGIPAQRCDLLRGERPGGRYDVVTAFEVIEHVPDAERFVAALGELCSERGFLLLSLPNTGFIWHRVRLLIGRFPVTSCHCHIKEHVRFWTVRDFVEWAGANGFEVQSVEGQLTRGGVGGNPRWLERRFPSLWAPLVIYKLRRRA